MVLIHSRGVFDHVLDAITYAIKKELGEDFKFHFDTENPVLTGEDNTAIDVE